MLLFIPPHLQIRRSCSCHNLKIFCLVISNTRPPKTCFRYFSRSKFPPFTPHFPGFLPTLHENEELELSDVPPCTSTRDLTAAASIPHGGGVVSAPSGPPSRSSSGGGGGGGGGGGVNVMPLSMKSLMATRHSRSSASAGEYPTSQHRRNVDAQGRTINPYHMTYCSSYNPVSAQDSELQSLSSDALTDTDTLGSLTDSSSVDRYPVIQTERYRKRQVKQEHRAIRHRFVFHMRPMTFFL